MYDASTHIDPRLTFPESDDGEFGAFRFGCQLTVVYEDKYYPFPQQSRLVQTKAESVTARQLLP